MVAHEQSIARIEAPQAVVTLDNPQQLLLAGLKHARFEHPFWDNRLFAACLDGALSRDDYAFIFSQYSLYSRGFTRYLAALMARCEDDLLRSRLSENLWEEGGGAQPEQRHAQIFREFLTDALGVDLKNLNFGDSATLFAREYLDFCLHEDPCAVSSFLSLGTEGIVPRMYEIFLTGMIQAGIPRSQLRFFDIHIAGDDAHAETLERIMLHYSDRPDWAQQCHKGLSRALELRLRFFESIYDELVTRRVAQTLQRIGARKSLQQSGITGAARAWRCGSDGEAVYSNEIEKHQILFSVQRLGVNAEVLDPRVVRIPPGKKNENHRHAHETVFCIISGAGEVTVGESVTPVATGDVVFVPRWAMHQSSNTGVEDLVILAVTDFGLTGRAYLGDYDKTARLKRVGQQ